mmetsp:Transcript_78768/g.210315  ORF Transcript_78768/g.210315 Transcript_78768/m.210315 type:complete len:242 (-) Transcript_78768:38-763(-)
MRRRFGKLAKGCQDRPVSRASAKVAVEVLLNLLVGRGRILLQQSIHVHHPPRRAIPALGPVPISHRLLHRVKPRLLPTDPLGCLHVQPVHAAQTPEAAIDGDGLGLATFVHAGQGYRTDSAASLLAAGMGALQTTLLAKPCQKRDGRRRVLHHHLLPIEPKPQLARPARRWRLRLSIGASDHLPVPVRLLPRLERTHPRPERLLQLCVAGDHQVFASGIRVGQGWREGKPRALDKGGEHLL